MADAYTSEHYVPQPRQRGQGDVQSDVQPTVTASPPRCHLLLLPRELRNRIYDFLHVNPRLTIRTIKECHDHDIPHVCLFGAALTSILSVNHQINEEYAEQVRHGSAAIHVSLRECNMFALGNLELKAGVVSGALRSVRNVAIDLHWALVGKIETKDEIHDFWSIMVPRPYVDQADVQWTPSKALRSKLSAFVRSIEPFVHPDAEVRLNIELNDLPEVQDPYTWTKFKAGRNTAVAMLQAFHAATFFGMEEDTDRSWPKARNLKVLGVLKVPLTCSMATNSSEIVAGRRSWESDGRSKVTMPQYDKSADTVLWVCRPTKDEPNWQGFEVLFAGVNAGYSAMSLTE
ncbi:hypothetical protein LTR56_007228 [Elasticomyces elasticus]|nr:hypothetical protein LTR56_007228 [Elasticomyces elasticus]KAK3663041.1 hypothetical protein LTR22_006205 [Elasticomyces elasticus]KAK4914482.1 hypothetical protein LTR49_017287 [Elasticomyces elasticus]KAK5753482.1 hypothetical protein LTS12_016434 [Elasticomyces elasticus]